MQREHIILATDLDGTLIPLDGNQRNHADLQTLKTEITKAGVTLIFVTGRHFELALDALQRYSLPTPEWMITDVGTSVRAKADDGQYRLVSQYGDALRNLVKESPRAAVEECLCAVDGLRLQEPEKQSEFKVSFYADAASLESLSAQCRQYLADSQLPWSLISSVDPFTQVGLIDLLPAGVSKAFALCWLAEHVGVTTDRIVFAGDSGNDLAVFAGGYRSIVVGNAHPDVANMAMRTHIRSGWTDRLYLAEESATSGVLAGCRWFGILSAERTDSALLGATPLGGSRVQFRVWAPDVSVVEVSIETGGLVPIQMHRDPNGYHTVTLEGIPPDAKYRYILDGDRSRPDPASRFQPDGVHGASQVIDFGSFSWNDGNWQGVPKRDLIIYEMHVGAFTEAGTFRAAIERLPELVELGVTAVELLPLAQTPGNWNWGYDGVNLFSVRNTYGHPDDFRAFVDACHVCGLAVILDVVYNHVGPEGNYLSEFGPYRSTAHNTPWGDALNFDATHASHVRRFVVENAVRWLSEYHLDGLRLDAVHFMYDRSDFSILDEVRSAVADFAETVRYPIHLIAESNVYDADLLASSAEQAAWDAIWCDCLMHAIYSTALPELRLTSRNYEGFSDVVQAVESGYIYSQQGESRVRKTHDCPDNPHFESLVVALQTHDSVGNHPQGKRLHQLASKGYQKAAAVLVLLSPSIPMIFMGEETASESRFPFFADFGDPSLRDAVDSGRQAGYPHHDWDDTMLPSDPRAFETAKWDSERDDADMRSWYRSLLTLRKQGIQAGWLSRQALKVQAESNCIVLDYAGELIAEVILDPRQPRVRLTSRNMDLKFG